MDAPRDSDDPAVDADPTLRVTPEVLDRFNGRVLEPATAARVAGQPRPRSTVYVGDALLLRSSTPPVERDRLEKAAAELGLELFVSRRREERASWLRERARRITGDVAAARTVELVQLRPLAGRAVIPDAWQLLQSYRAAGGAPGLVGLDHLLTANRHVSPSPFDVGGPAAPAVATYGQPGWGGRQPVNWLGPVPARPPVDHRRPVVAVLDTGVGEHDWFPFPAAPVAGSGIVRNVDFGGERLGLEEQPGSAVSGSFADELEGTLLPYPGHGTFIAGLIRQQAPGADILSIRVMPGEGAVPEHVLLDALHRLALRQAHAVAGGEKTRDEVVDIVSLSLGYYDETPPGEPVDAFLLEPITLLGKLGVTVVVAAGNDATSRPMYPAAFAAHPGGPVPELSADQVPVVSVGATNPDGTTALFSNAGDWVTTTAPGAALVSTYPRVDAGAQPSVLFWTSGGWRASIDPDGFAAGFAVWSGTSFAAPVLAGRLAAALLAVGSQLDATSAAEMTDRAWSALRTCVPDVARPPVTP